ncbi:UNVERIFIED_CONTAM: hypothetical protein N8J90_15020 [Halobacillus marinus]|nr:hypothetical protein [Halobacillus sp. BAB-2008]QHT48738.1 hypothetical protein M662_15685 [Bacillus sp. SB49]
MLINHGGVLQKEYFVSYMKLIRNAMGCSVEKAKDVTFERLFHNDVQKLGEATYQEFLKGYQEMQRKH